MKVGVQENKKSDLLEQAVSEECMCRVREMGTFIESGVSKYTIETLAFRIM